MHIISSPSLVGVGDNGTRVILSDLLFFILMQALAKALTEDELIYLRAQFNLLEPKDGCILLENFRVVSSWFLQLYTLCDIKACSYSLNNDMLYYYLLTV